MHMVSTIQKCFHYFYELLLTYKDAGGQIFELVETTKKRNISVNEKTVSKKEKFKKAIITTKNELDRN